MRQNHTCRSGGANSTRRSGGDERLRVDARGRVAREAHGERIWPDESGSHRAVPKAGIGCARGFAVFALQLPSPEPMPFRSRLHEAGHVRDGRGARTENSRGGKTVACAVLSAGPLGAATKSAEDSARYNACGSETPG